MFAFGERSKNNLNSCHKDLQKLMNVAIQTSPIDF